MDIVSGLQFNTDNNYRLIVRQCINNVVDYYGICNIVNDNDTVTYNCVALEGLCNKDTFITLYSRFSHTIVPPNNSNYVHRNEIIFLDPDLGKQFALFSFNLLKSENIYNLNSKLYTKSGYKSGIFKIVRKETINYVNTVLYLIENIFEKNQFFVFDTEKINSCFDIVIEPNGMTNVS